MGKYDKDKWFPFWTEMWGWFPLWVWAVCSVIIEARIGTFQQNIFGCGVWLIFYKAITHKGRYDEDKWFPLWVKTAAWGMTLFIFYHTGWDEGLAMVFWVVGGFLGCYTWWQIISHGSDRYDNDDGDGGY